MSATGPDAEPPLEAQQAPPRDASLGSAADEARAAKARAPREGAAERALSHAPDKLRRVVAPGGGDMASAGLQFAAALLLFTLGGHWLDGRFGTKPWLLLVGLALGLVGGFYSLLRKAQAASRG